VKPQRKEIDVLRAKNVELESAMAWGEQSMKQMQEEVAKDRAELNRLRKECFAMAEENETLREKVAGALKTLMGNWDLSDEDY
jgi:SMC interacting uncharacterized protein involved in chromosome segregation